MCCKTVSSVQVLLCWRSQSRRRVYPFLRNPLSRLAVDSCPPPHPHHATDDGNGARRRLWAGLDDPWLLYADITLAIATLTAPATLTATALTLNMADVK